MLEKRSRTSAFLLVLFSACSGSDGGPTPTAPPPPPPPAAPIVSHPASGTIYTRSDATAYPADFAPTSGLGGASATLAGSTVQAAGSGAYSLRSPFSIGSDFVPLRASASGYMESWYPWIPPDTLRQMNLGLYPEVPVVARPGFLKGIILMDGGGNISGWLANGSVQGSANRVKNTVGANAIAYPDLLRVLSFNTTTNEISLIEEPLGSGNPNFTNVFGQVASSARTQGLSVMLYLMLFSPSASVNPSSVPVSNTEFWDAWFAAVRPWIVDRATFAHANGVEYLVLALPQYMMSFGSPRMRGIIDAIRGTGYRGKVHAFFGVRPARAPRGFYGYRFVDPAFWSLFDGVEIQMANVIPMSAENEMLANAQSRQRMRLGIKQILDELVTLPLPVYVSLTTASVHGGASAIGPPEPCLQCPTTAPQLTRDYLTQADVYQAFAEVVNGTPMGNGRVAGLTSWGYVWNDNLIEFEAYGRSAFDKAPSVRGKPAESVLKWWFARW